MTQQPGEYRPRRHPVLTVLMVVFGAILLLPGVCALVFMVGSGFTLGVEDSWILTLWAICLAIAFGGAMLIRQALRRPRPQ
jgi:uncharacterized membrane protein YraQ (UPF0718 family)